MTIMLDQESSESDTGLESYRHVQEHKVKKRLIASPIVHSRSSAANFL